MKKTNAARLLDAKSIHYELAEYEVDESDLSATTLAKKIGQNIGQIFKTLVLRGDKTGVLMACIPAHAELNLKALAAASGNKHVEMTPLKDVRPLTGYVRGGCSPLGGKKNYPVYLDVSALAHPQIYISAGLRGVQIFLNPEDLVRAVNGTVAELARNPGA